MNLALQGDGDRRRCLVVVFLRGAADGLHLVPPVGDDDYHRARPLLAVRPDAGLRLDDRFAFHPLLAPLLPLFREGRLAVIHAAGSEDETRSHFAAQDLMEHGGLTGGGWLGRFLRDSGEAGALGAVALGTVLPESLRGSPSATVLRSLADFSLGAASPHLLGDLARLWDDEPGDLGRFARDTLTALERIEALQKTPYRPTARYGSDRFAEGLAEVARLIKARVGLAAATLDLDGWDSHFTQGPWIEPRMAELAQGLVAFLEDLGPDAATTSVVVMTEFGRRVRENASLGTDHGRGGVMFVAGGGVQGGRVIADWPGLADEHLVGPGDLPVVHNYRDALAPILRRHGARDLAAVFPGHPLAELAL